MPATMEGRCQTETRGTQLHGTSEEQQVTLTSSMFPIIPNVSLRLTERTVHLEGRRHCLSFLNLALLRQTHTWAYRVGTWTGSSMVPVHSGGQRGCGETWAAEKLPEKTRGDCAAPSGVWA